MILLTGYGQTENDYHYKMCDLHNLLIVERDRHSRKIILCLRTGIIRSFGKTLERSDVQNFLPFMMSNVFPYSMKARNIYVLYLRYFKVIHYQ